MLIKHVRTPDGCTMLQLDCDTVLERTNAWLWRWILINVICYL